MKKQKTILFLIIGLLILSLFLIPLTISQDTPPMPPTPVKDALDNPSTPTGTPQPSAGGEIDPATGLPKDVLPIKNLGDTLSDEDKRTAYLKAEWQKILLKSKTFGPWVEFLLKLDPVSNFLMGIPITFSWFYFLTLVIFIDLLIFMFRLTWFFRISQAIHYAIFMAISIVFIYFRVPKNIASWIVSILSLMNVWWMQYVIIGIVIVAIIVAAYFSKELKTIAKSMKEHKEKIDEEINRNKLKKDVKVGEILRKGLSSI